MRCSNLPRKGNAQLVCPRVSVLVLVLLQAVANAVAHADVYIQISFLLQVLSHLIVVIVLRPFCIKM